MSNVRRSKHPSFDVKTPTQMEDRFAWSRGVSCWLGIVAALGILAVVEGQQGMFPGVWLLFAGAGLILVGGVIGSARTGSWFSWQEKVKPTYFEAIMGLTGAVLAACPLLVFSVRFVALYVKQASA